MGNPRGVRRNFEQLEQRRLEACRCFGAGLSAAEAARHLGVHRQSTSKWRRQWLRAGTTALKRTGPPGRKPKLTDKQLTELAKIIARCAPTRGPAKRRWSTKRIVRWIYQRWKVRYHPDHVYRLRQG